jgi:hypothetical protein
MSFSSSARSRRRYSALLIGFLLVAGRSKIFVLVTDKGWINLFSRSFAVVLCVNVRWLLSITTLICDSGVPAGGNVLRDWVGLAVGVFRGLSGRRVELGALSVKRPSLKIDV